MKFVQVEWEDARSDSTAWHEFHKPLELSRITTCGWLVFEDDRRIVLTSTWNHSENEAGDMWVIPRGCVVSVTELSLAQNVAI